MIELVQKHFTHTHICTHNKPYKINLLDENGRINFFFPQLHDLLFIFQVTSIYKQLAKKKGRCEDNCDLIANWKRMLSGNTPTIDSFVPNLSKNTERVLKRTQFSRFSCFTKRGLELVCWTLLRTLWRGGHSQCAQSFAMVPDGRLDVFIARWVATHTVAATLPHVVTLDVTPLERSASIEVLVSKTLMGGFL